MESSETDTVFAGSIPKLYDTYLVPLLFGRGPVDGKMQAHVVTVER